jgi:activator of 2-hydroxyglutaryl-CoA dehydratase
MIVAGIDAGSRTIKVCLVEAATLEPVAWGLADQGVEQVALARRLFETASNASSPPATAETSCPSPTRP